MGREIVGSMSEWSGVLRDFFRQINDRSINLQEVQAFLEHRDSFAARDSLDQLVFKAENLLSKRFGKKIKVDDPLPTEFTLDKARKMVLPKNPGRENRW